MASSSEDAIVGETVALDNATNASAPGRQAASFEGLMTAYIALLIMSLLPIYIGALRSVRFHGDLKKKGEKASDNITARDAMFYPLYASVALFGLYIFFKFVPKDIINMVLGGFFFVVCVGGLARTLSLFADPIFHKLFGTKYPEYKLSFTKKLSEKGDPKEVTSMEFTWSDILVLLLSIVIGIWHLITKHWILNNAFGLAFSLNAVEMVSLNNVKAGFILLGGLFIYDIFWVFGTDVMVTVAKSLEAPIKLMFPMDLLEKGIFAGNFSMLGLGDIVIPGIFIALLCRFDQREFPRRFKLYFHLCFVAYIIGLVVTVMALHMYNAAQPALLYLVPACLGLPCGVALIKGDLPALLSFEDYPETPERTESEAKDK